MIRIKQAEIRQVLNDYSGLLTGWAKSGNDRLYRIDGPIAQSLWLDRLRTGGYRPTFYVKTLCVPNLPGGMELPQHLDVKFHSVILPVHKSSLPRIFEAAKCSVYPSIVNRLDAFSVFTEYQKRAIPTPVEAVSLMALSCYFGKRSRFDSWMKVYNKLKKSRYSNVAQQFDSSYSRFIDELQTMWANGDSQSMLNAIIAESIKSEGWSEESAGAN